MLRNTKVQMAAVLAAGALLGYLAAAGKLNPLSRAGATSPAAPAGAVKPAESDGGDKPACCEKVNKGQLLAQGSPGGLSSHAAVLAPAHAADDEVIVFEVLLPASALLEIDGNKTTETGEKRTYETPPLPAGGRYHYTLKATLGDKVVTRQMHLAHGAANTLDLRPDFQAADAPRPSAKALAQKPAESQKPNILFIMGDDIGWMQPSCYHQGLMVGETPNIDRIAREGMRFLDYYAMQSCTSGRCAFVTGMYPLRAGMVQPQLPGSPSYLQPGTPCIGQFLLDQGYTTGQFGKNHLVHAG
jgi:uncharacterized protein (TIGR03000 family)